MKMPSLIIQVFFFRMSMPDLQEQDKWDQHNEVTVVGRYNVSLSKGL